ncbi:Long-chain-fatty-acid--CoA ligase 5 [Symbiodinium microadriaticum]|uniref:Long-chain-fatty-acid--CoA ligase 5 n=1 Tax=Symbiodinium microadriaticum TaxID=2951 RepID=A0A1Q9E9F5_SYMMI|nr:Long-chain-fatty-acid--CoA ligase 5 [Symbiodinium microadriaticum]
MVYTKVVPGTEDPEHGWGSIHRSCDGREPSVGMFDPDTKEQIKTSYENFQLSRKKFANRPCLGFRPIAADGTAGPYVWSTYEQIGKRADNFGAGLVNLELCPSKPDPEVKDRGMLGFYSKNRLEWVVAEQACFSQSIVTVPMYDTLGADSVAYVIKQCSLKSVICAAAVLENVLDCKPDCPTLECVILMEPLTEDLRSKASSAGLKAFSMEEVEKVGAEKPLPHLAPSPQDILTFCYTSGTTGDPKGVLLTHQNLCSAWSAASGRDALKAGDGDIHMSYLPLPHIFERLVQFGVILGGAAIGFYQGDTLKIVEDLQALRPTFFPSVPRLLNRVHDRRQQISQSTSAARILVSLNGPVDEGMANGGITFALSGEHSPEMARKSLSLKTRMHPITAKPTYRSKGLLAALSIDVPRQKEEHIFKDAKLAAARSRARDMRKLHSATASPTLTRQESPEIEIACI